MAAQPTPLRAAPARSASRLRAVEPVETTPKAARLAAVALLKLALRIPAAAVVSVGVLYLLGIVWTWGQIQDAGVAPGDVISLVPRSEILDRGLQLAFLAVLALPLPLAFAWLLHRLLPEAGRPWGLPAGLAQLRADHQRLRRDVDELRGGTDPVRPAVYKRVRRLHARAKTQAAAQRRTALLTRVLIVLALVSGLFVLTPARFAVALFGLWLMRRTSLGRVQTALAVLGVLVVAVAAERFTAPDPLSDASIRTTRGALVSGPLVAATDDQWHIVVADDTVKSVPTLHIAKASVYTEPRHVRGPLGARPLDIFR